MDLKTFKGGVHPADGKELSKDVPLRELLPGKELIFPLSQHIGAPASAIVAKGDRVLKGQKIAEAGGFVSSPIFSSVSGTVKAIAPHRVAVGDMVMSIVIENDEEYEEVAYTPCSDYSELSNEEIIGKIKEAGIVGLGGAGFPTHVKLSPKNPDQIEYIICNAAECEPYLTSDYRRMMDNTAQLVEGMKIILQLFPNAKGIFGVENNKPECIRRLKRLVQHNERISVCPLQTKYPQGGERQLIYATTGRSINSKMLPADAGCIVDNVETMFAIYKAVVEGKPIIRRIFTVTGDAVEKHGNIAISLGTSFSELLEAAGGLKESGAEKLIAGGPMMGFALFDINIPTAKTTSALLCMTKDAISAFEETACINCGRCVEACPEQLVPSRLADYGARDQKAEFEKWYGLECVECGSCSFACPARRPLAQSIKTMKKFVLADKRKG